MKTRKGPHRSSFEDRIRRSQDLVKRIQSSRPSENDTYAVIALSERGIPVDAIYPRETVLSFDCWLAFGRHVRKGEKAIAVPTWTPVTRTDEATGTRQTVTRTDKATGEQKTVLRPTAAYLFGIWQTEPNANPHPDYWTLSATMQKALQLCANLTPAESVQAPEPEPEIAAEESNPLPVTIGKEPLPLFA